MSAAGEAGTGEASTGEEWPAAFSWLSPVFFDELDVNGALHNSRFAVHVERAQSALFERLGKGWTRLADRDPDLRYVVRELHLEFLAPLTAPGALRVELTARKLGRTSATYGFRCCAPESGQVIAHGHRVIVKIDEEGRPTPWSDWYRQVFGELTTGLPGTHHGSSGNSPRVACPLPSDMNSDMNSDTS